MAYANCGAHTQPESRAAAGNVPRAADANVAGAADAALQNPTTAAPAAEPRPLETALALAAERLRKATKATPPTEKPEVVEMHLLHNMIILRGDVRQHGGCLQRQGFNQVEIKPEMTDCSLGEFSNTYKLGKPSQPSTRAAFYFRIIPLEWPIKAQTYLIIMMMMMAK
ncbi:small ribosomal subunit protein uS19-like [Saccopteryx bilineata]|uniref:small ribosomal subunit protein uS19-like n=1 Tax=Saccopteryx bilineata TaxID=59482 RepID=UPI00338F26DB